MTISSSLNAGVAGLNANATRLATIADNIANSDTFGYRRAETGFHSLVIPSSGHAYSAGGVRSHVERMVDDGGALITTNNPTDLAVQGRGMLPVANVFQLENGDRPGKMLMTPTGAFRPDNQGRLVTDSGLVLLGWPANADGSVNEFPRDTVQGLEPVRLNLNTLTGEVTTRIGLGVNLPATSTEAGSDGSTHRLSVEYFDNIGSSENLNFEFTSTVPEEGRSNAWTMRIYDSADGPDPIGEYVLQFDDGRAAKGTLHAVTRTSGGDYDPETGKMIVEVAGGPMEIDIGRPGDPSGMTQRSDIFAPQAITKDGSAVGNMIGATVDADGFVYARYDTGVIKTIYQVPLVDVPNLNGLRVSSYETYAPSTASGSFYMWNAGDGPTGDVVPYARQESATDVAAELTSMIQTQRAYSSNARVIQTVDEILKETTNIIR